MEANSMFSTENFFGRYEQIIRAEVGKELDDFKHLIGQIENKCTVRITSIDYHRPDKGSPITTESLMGYSSDIRCKILAALLYNDALYRLEAAHLMMCIGSLNVAYANLRNTIEFLQTAFIVERCDTEALRFLQNELVDLSLMDKLLINPEYSTHLKKLKDSYNLIGVHRYASSLQLSSLFGANRFDKLINQKVQKSLKLPDGFSIAAKECIQQGGQVGILFSWLESLPVKTLDNDTVT